jgi:hypothetical protein
VKILHDVDARQYAALRIVFGVLAMASILTGFSESTFYYSDEGWLPVRHAVGLVHRMDWSLLFTITTPLGVKVFFLFAVVTSLAMTVGFFSRTATWATFVCLVSLQVRDRYFLNGGDTVVRVILFYLGFSRCGLAWSVDSLRRRYRPEGKERLPAFAPPAKERLAGNLPLRLIQIQMCIVYFTSGLAKLHGIEWIDGDALRHVLQQGVLVHYNFDWITPGSFWEKACRLMTWTTLVFEVGFPLFMLHRWTRWATLGMGILFHATIAALIDIPLFCYLMMASYLAFLPDALFRRVEVIARRKFRRKLGPRLRRLAAGV